MKAELYRESPVLLSFLQLRGEADKYPKEYVPRAGAKPDPRFRMVPAGYVIEHPDAWRLVRQGTAKPADDDCRVRAGVSPEDMIRKHDRQILLEAGKLTGDPKFDAPDKEA
jgi:hypothetical protein